MSTIDGVGVMATSTTNYDGRPRQTRMDGYARRRREVNVILLQGFGERRGTERAFPGQGINVGLGNDGGGEVIRGRDKLILGIFTWKLLQLLIAILHFAIFSYCNLAISNSS